MSVVAQGFGILRAVLEAARAEERCSREALTVLDRDPYRLDTPAGHRDGAWIAEQVERTFGPLRRFHWRGLHYAMVVRGDALKPNGETYVNTADDWEWLCETAGKAARWLGYVSFERIVDRRNDDPVIHRAGRVTPYPFLAASLHVDIPDVSDIEPYVGMSNFTGRQPYSLAIFGEKASLEDVLLPVAQRYEADLYLPTGEISDTLLWRMAKDGAADGRPLVIFTVSDFDPAGHQMPVSIGRKLQALRDLSFPGLEIEIVPTALTAEQVRRFGLPSTPLKEAEKRADKWREVFGIEQTEIDALLIPRPRELARIVEAAIEPYYDESLSRRVRATEQAWRAAAQEAVDAEIDHDALDELSESAAERLEALKQEIDAINDRIRGIVAAIELPPTPAVPEPEIGAEKLGRRAPLVSSSQSWAEATQALKIRKSYGGGQT
jgi:hypothetical protein